MGSKRVKFSTQIYKFLDDNPNFTKEALIDEYKHFKIETVKTNYKRWHKKRTSAKNSKRSGSISKNGSNNSTPKKPITSLSPDLQNIKNIMQSFNTNSNSSVRFGEVANYLIKTEALNIVAEGVTQSLKRMDNTKLLQFIKPTPDLSEISLEEYSQQESLQSMSSLQRLNYLTKMNQNNSDKLELPLTPSSRNASSSEPEEEAKHST